MKVLTWNMGYWLHPRTQEQAREHLRGRLKPDIALLQETKPVEPQDADVLLFREIRQGWGTAVYARGLELEDVPYEGEYPGRVVVAKASLADGTELYLASIHAPIISGRVFPYLSRIIDKVEESVSGKTAIVGGDLNSARLAEVVWPDCGHGPFFERMDRSRYVNCCWEINGREIQTFFKKGTKHPFQDDHLFVSQDLLPMLAECDVIDDSVTRKVSDHIPLAIKLRMGDQDWQGVAG